MPRRPAPRFIARPRQIPDHVADPPDLLDVVRAASSLCDEPEKLGPAILDSQGRDARHFDAVRYAAAIEEAQQARPALSPEARVRDAEARARVQHRNDLRGELRALGEAVARARRAQPARLVERDDGFIVSESRPLALTASAMARLERVEAALDRAPNLARAPDA